MQKLRELWNAAKAADAKVQSIHAEMVAALDDGTEEGKQKALDLRPALDEAKAAADAANLLYIDARDAEPEDPDAAARLFVPVPASQSQPAKVMTRAEFDQLPAAKKQDFMLADGHLTD